MDDIYLNRSQTREEFWSPTGLTQAQLAEERKKNEEQRQWNENTAKGSDQRPIHDGGNCSHGYRDII